MTDDGGAPEGAKSELERLIEGFADVVKLGAAAAAAFLPVALPAEIVPRQLSPILAAGSMITLLGFLVGAAFRDRMQTWRRGLVLAAVLGGLGAVTLRVALVVPVTSGDPPVTEDYLVGFRLSAQGQAMVADARLTRPSRPQLVAAIGYDQIPRLYGWSYTLAFALLTLCLYTLLLCTVVGITAFPRGDP